MSYESHWFLQDAFWQVDQHTVIANHHEFLERQKPTEPISFYGMHLTVDSGVYHPLECSSTHLLADAALSLFLPGMKVLEIGCGAAGVSCLLAQRGAARVVAADINDRALRIARQNAEVYGQGVVEVVRSDLFDQIDEHDFDLVLFNPPLLHCAPMAATLGLSADFDQIAIDPDGTVLYRYVQQSGDYVPPGGQVAFLASNIGARSVLGEAVAVTERAIGPVSVTRAYFKGGSRQWRYVLSAKRA